MKEGAGRGGVVGYVSVIFNRMYMYVLICILNDIHRDRESHITLDICSIGYKILSDGSPDTVGTFSSFLASDSNSIPDLSFC